jgi:hypothetical protein
MIATRTNKSALFKSRMDRLELQLKEMEATTAQMRQGFEQLKEQVQEVSNEELVLPSFLAPVAPRAPVIRRPITPQLLPPRIKIVKVKNLKRKGIKTVFTEEILAQIPRWVAEGLTRSEIAGRIGCTRASLQVTCSKKGISLWHRDRNRARNIEVIYEGAEA